MALHHPHTCQDCGYFRQHYIWHQKLVWVCDGHCVHPPRKRRCRPDLPACAKWIPQDEGYKNERTPTEEKAPRF